MLAALVAVPVLGREQAARGGVSDRPDTPFKLATFEAQSKVRLGHGPGVDKVLDIAGANQQLAQQAKLAAVAIPTEMRTLIEEYDRVKPRLYQIANYFKTAMISGRRPLRSTSPTSRSKPQSNTRGTCSPRRPTTKHTPRAWAARRLLPQRPRALPRRPEHRCATWCPGGRPAVAGGGFDPRPPHASSRNRDAPIFFAKSPRSCIIDPGEPFYIVDGRQRTDYEVRAGHHHGTRPAYRVPREQAHDYVFGYSLGEDVTDRGSERLREVSMFAGNNWFDGKSVDRGAPFGPVIVPKEFLPNPDNLKNLDRS